MSIKYVKNHLDSNLVLPALNRTIKSKSFIKVTETQSKSDDIESVVIKGWASVSDTEPTDEHQEPDEIVISTTSIHEMSKEEFKAKVIDKNNETAQVNDPAIDALEATEATETSDGTRKPRGRAAKSAE